MTAAPLLSARAMACLGLIAPLCWVQAAQGAVSVGGFVAMSSDYVLRGVSQNGDDAALQGDVHLNLGSNWSFGVWGSEVKLTHYRHSLELNPYVQWRRPLGEDFDFAVSATGYVYPNDPRPIGYNYQELSVTAGWRDQLYATVRFAPEVTLFSNFGFTGYGYELSRDTRVLNFELSTHRTLRPHLDAVLGVAYYDPLGLDYATYTYGSAALDWHYGKWRADLAWILVQGDNHRWYSQGPAGGPLTLTVAWNF